MIDTVDPDRCLVQGCRYYITVEGARESAFSLTASTSGGSTLLIDGVAASGSVTPDASDQFTFVYNGKLFEYLVVTFAASLYGPTIVAYISDSDYEPTASNYFYALHPQANTITFTKDRFSCQAERCVLLFAVIGSGEYMLTARSQSAITAISNSVESGSILTSQQLYYSRTFPLQHGAFDFVLFLKGYVTAYLSCSPSAASSSPVIKPNSTHYTWKLASWDVARLAIPIDADPSTYCFRSGDGSRVLITLEGMMNDFFLLSARLPNATNHDDSPTLMAPWQTITGFIDSADFQYFTIRPNISLGPIRSAIVSR